MEISGRLWVLISMQHFAPSLCVCVCSSMRLQNGLSTRVTKVSMKFSVKVSVYSRRRQVIRRTKVVLCGVRARLIAVWLHLDADLGHGLAWRQVQQRVPRGKARLGVGRWGGAGDLQVQRDAEKQWWNFYSPISPIHSVSSLFGTKVKLTTQHNCPVINPPSWTV